MFTFDHWTETVGRLSQSPQLRRLDLKWTGTVTPLSSFYITNDPRLVVIAFSANTIDTAFYINSPIFLTSRLRISCERCDIKLRATNAYFFSIRADIFSWKVLKKICLKISERISNVVDSSESFVNIAKSNFVNILNGDSDTSSQNVVSDWL